MDPIADSSNIEDIYHVVRSAWRQCQACHYKDDIRQIIRNLFSTADERDTMLLVQALTTELVTEFMWNSCNAKESKSSPNADGSHLHSHESKPRHHLHLDLRHSSDTLAAEKGSPASLRMSPTGTARDNSHASPTQDRPQYFSSYSGRKSSPSESSTSYPRDHPDTHLSSANLLENNNDSIRDHQEDTHPSGPAGSTKGRELAYFRFNLPPSRLGTVSLPTASELDLAGLVDNNSDIGSDVPSQDSTDSSLDMMEEPAFAQAWEAVIKHRSQDTSQQTRGRKANRSDIEVTATDMLTDLIHNVDERQVIDANEDEDAENGDICSGSSSISNEDDQQSSNHLTDDASTEAGSDDEDDGDDHYRGYEFGMMIPNQKRSSSSPNRRGHAVDDEDEDSPGDVRWTAHWLQNQPVHYRDVEDEDVDDPEYVNNLAIGLALHAASDYASASVQSMPPTAAMGLAGSTLELREHIELALRSVVSAYLDADVSGYSNSSSPIRNSSKVAVFKIDTLDQISRTVSRHLGFTGSKSDHIEIAIMSVINMFIGAEINEENCSVLSQVMESVLERHFSHAEEFDDVDENNSPSDNELNMDDTEDIDIDEPEDGSEFERANLLAGAAKTSALADDAEFNFDDDIALPRVAIEPPDNDNEFVVDSESESESEAEASFDDDSIDVVVPASNQPRSPSGNVPGSATVKSPSGYTSSSAAKISPSAPPTLSFDELDFDGRDYITIDDLPEGLLSGLPPTPIAGETQQTPESISEIQQPNASQGPISDKKPTSSPTRNELRSTLKPKSVTPDRSVLPPINDSSTDEEGNQRQINRRLSHSFNRPVSARDSEMEDIVSYDSEECDQISELELSRAIEVQTGQPIDDHESFQAARKAHYSMEYTRASAERDIHYQVNDDHDLDGNDDDNDDDEEIDSDLKGDDDTDDASDEDVGEFIGSGSSRHELMTRFWDLVEGKDTGTTSATLGVPGAVTARKYIANDNDIELGDEDEEDHLQDYLSKKPVDSTPRKEDRHEFHLRPSSPGSPQYLNRPLSASIYGRDKSFNSRSQSQGSPPSATLPTAAVNADRAIASGIEVYESLDDSAWEVGIEPTDHPSIGPVYNADGSLRLTRNPQLNSLLRHSFQQHVMQYSPLPTALTRSPPASNIPVSIPATDTASANFSTRERMHWGALDMDDSSDSDHEDFDDDNGNDFEQKQTFAVDNDYEYVVENDSSSEYDLPEDEDEEIEWVAAIDRSGGGHSEVAAEFPVHFNSEIDRNEHMTRTSSRSGPTEMTMSELESSHALARLTSTSRGNERGQSYFQTSEHSSKSESPPKGSSSRQKTKVVAKGQKKKSSTKKKSSSVLSPDLIPESRNISTGRDASLMQLASRSQSRVVSSSSGRTGHSNPSNNSSSSRAMAPTSSSLRHSLPTSLSMLSLDEGIISSLKQNMSSLQAHQPVLKRSKSKRTTKKRS